MRHNISRGANIPHAGLAARLQVQYENTRDAITGHMATIEQNPYVRNLMETGSHMTLFDTPTMLVETGSAVVNAYQESHLRSGHTTESYDSSHFDHRNDSGLEHKARDSLEADENADHSANDITPTESDTDSTSPQEQHHDDTMIAQNIENPSLDESPIQTAEDNTQASDDISSDTNADSVNADGAESHDQTSSHESTALDTTSGPQFSHTSELAEQEHIENTAGIQETSQVAESEPSETTVADEHTMEHVATEDHTTEAMDSQTMQAASNEAVAVNTAENETSSLSPPATEDTDYEQHQDTPVDVSLESLAVNEDEDEDEDMDTL